MQWRVKYNLPILTVLLDNGGWSAVKESTLRMYPLGEAKNTDQFASDLGYGTDFAAIAEAAGAHGERLVDPAQVTASIERCLAALDCRPKCTAACADNATLMAVA